MLEEALSFWNAIKGKVREAIREDTRNAVRMERYDVTTAPNGTKIGVSQPFGDEIFVPYSAEVANAQVGDTVLLVWWNSLSTAKAYYFGDGYNGGAVTSVNGQTGAVDTRAYDFSFVGTSDFAGQVDTALATYGAGSYTFVIPSGADNGMPSNTYYYGLIQCTSVNFVQVICWGNTGSLNTYRRLKTNGTWLAWRRAVESISGEEGALYGHVFMGSTNALGITDFNDMTTDGLYYINSTGMSNAPDTNYVYAHLYVTHGTNNYITQLFVRSSSSYVIAVRQYSGNPSTWGAWRQVHPTPTYDASSSGATLSVSSSTTTTLLSVSLSPGKYMVSFGATFASNATGCRAVAISTTTSISNAGYPAVNRVPTVSGTTAWISCTTPLNITATTTIYFLVYQNSGSALNVSGNYRILKFA